MTQIHAPQPDRRTNADYRWTRTKIHAFVTALARTGEVAAAAREVGMSRQSAYRLRARLGPQFTQVWNEGLAWAEELRQERRFHKVTPPPPQGDAQGDTSAA